MKFARSTLLLAAMAFAGQAVAATPVRPSTATVMLQPAFQSGIRTATPAGKSKLGGGSAILPLVLLAGVAAGGIIVATKDNGHDSVSP
ncbi:hypothetical protein [Sphingomonas oryzagri]